MYLCWWLEDICDCFRKDNKFYPSFKWEILYEIELIKKVNKK